MYDQREQTISRSSILYGTNADDVWFNLDQFYKDQIQEVNQKLSQLDDGIWGKIVIMEKNRRVAKAYLRVPRFRVDGSCHEFDGQRIGFKSLSNGARDSVVEEIREKIGVVLIKMDQQGNILAKRCEGSSPAIVQGWDRPGAYCLGSDVADLRGRLEMEKPARVFDMRMFKASIEHEMRQTYPDRKKLLYKSATRISLVKDEPHPFKTPCWFMLINLVALDMLNSKVVPIFPPIPSSGSSESPLSAASRCQSISSDLHLAGKHLSVSSNDLYFSPHLLPASTATVFREAASPAWSETYEDLAETTSGDSAPSPSLPSEQILSAKLANSLALGFGGYATPVRPRWSTALARSMDCLYGTAQPIVQPEVAIIPQAPSRRFPHHGSASGDLDGSHPVVLVVEQAPRHTAGRQEQRKTYAVIHHQRCADKNMLMPDEDGKTIYGAGRPAGRQSAASAVSDSDASLSSGGGTSQQQEIYESTSTNSSNTSSSSGVFCRPSSPSITSETTSESHSADSAFTSGSYGRMSSTSIPTSIPPVASIPIRRGLMNSTGHTMSSAAVAPEPPPRPQSLFKNAIRSRLFGGLGILNVGDSVLENKRAALARYNNIRLDDSDSPAQSFVNGCGIKFSTGNSVGCRNNGRTTLFKKNCKKSNTFSLSSDSESEVCRL